MCLVVVCIISFSGCVLFAYLWLDRSISLAYSDVSYEKYLGFERLSFIVEYEWYGISEQKLLEKLKAVSARHPDERIVIFKDNESDVIVFDTIEFELNNGRLVRIKYQ